MDSHEPRDKAPDVPPAAWHLHWQAAVGQTFLPDPLLADRIRDRLVAAHTRGGRVLLDYTILPTEIHLIARLSDADAPAEVARAIGNVVARWVREATHVRSPVMAGPFRSCVIHSDDEIRAEMRMLAWRPVVLGLCR